MAFVYLIFHSVTGENGLISYVKVRGQVKERNMILRKKLADLEILKRRVDLISSKTLDLDFLEERCRAVLNYCYPEDVVLRDKAISLLR
ncbi:MAG: septum formation initiator family protein [Holosporales bacterium]|nr:septum formation initiator family protein [Holosporales bacterium]